MGSLGTFLRYPDDIYPLLKMKRAIEKAEKQIPPEPHWAFCYSMLHKVSRSFSLVIQQLGTELRNAIVAIGTLALCYNNVQVFRGSLKLRRGLIAKVFDRTKTMDDVCGAFYDFSCMLETKVDKKDPNAMKTLNRLETIKKVCREYGGDIHQRKSYVNDEIQSNALFFTNNLPPLYTETADCSACASTGHSGLGVSKTQKNNVTLTCNIVQAPADSNFESMILTEHTEIRNLKNKRISKGRKGGKKKIVDPFSKKDWYDIKAPSIFKQRNVGKTLVSRTQGTKIASEGLKHRVFEVSLADLQADEDHSYRKIRLRAEDVQGRNVLTQFWGMDFTTDKLRSLVKKWQTLIEAHVDVKTTDSYTLRLFCIAFTKRRANQVKRTCYAQSSQIRQIRRKMSEIMVKEASSCDLKELVAKFIPESIGRDIEKATQNIYPLQNVFIRKVKILKAPKFDLGKLMEVHGDYTAEDVGVKVDRPDETVAEEPTEIIGA
ncbi:hypothetical protein F2Q69_00057902 [Brassica cretica]|uniref:Small ribosomal subunit protein eS1 n=1 Tax=Brassica cretica TaxID=69181 RepID=A0A8S9NA79_BRACR|nr:hypothetical protein F2Q69_00057902 [Brassica cretica]